MFGRPTAEQVTGWADGVEAVGWSSLPESVNAEWDVRGFDPRDNRFQLVPVTRPYGSRALVLGTFRVREPVPDLPPGQKFALGRCGGEPYGCVFLG